MFALFLLVSCTVCYAYGITFVLSVNYSIFNTLRGAAVASCLMLSSPDRVVHVHAPVGDIVLCSWARHLTLTVHHPVV